MNNYCEIRSIINQRLQDKFVNCNGSKVEGLQFEDINCGFENDSDVFFRMGGNNPRQRRQKRNKQLDDVNNEHKRGYLDIKSMTDVGIRFNRDKISPHLERLVNGVVFVMTLLNDWQFTFKC